MRHAAERLAAVARGEAFLLQGGDCAETFAAVTTDQVRDKVRTLLQMAVVLTYGASVPVVKVGRIAGQFAKPRSTDLEALTGLPSYRGDAVNDLDPSPQARIPDPRRMLRAYQASCRDPQPGRGRRPRAALRTSAQVHGGTPTSSAARRPASDTSSWHRTSTGRWRFMRACGVDLDHEQSLHGVEFYASHEALLLDYERALTRYDDDRGALYDLSGAHGVDRRAHPGDGRRPRGVRPPHRQPDRA